MLWAHFEAQLDNAKLACCTFQCSGVRLLLTVCTSCLELMILMTQMVYPPSFKTKFGEIHPKYFC